MTIEDAIKKAIDGGWVDPKRNDVPTIYLRSHFFLDPAFWQSLGKAMGWDKGVFFYNTFIDGKENNEGWRVYWHRFIDHLAEGESPEEFFEELK